MPLSQRLRGVVAAGSQNSAHASWLLCLDDRYRNRGTAWSSVLSSKDTEAQLTEAFLDIVGGIASLAN